jgi:hypothetical protein
MAIGLGVYSGERPPKGATLLAAGSEVAMKHRNPCEAGSSRYEERLQMWWLRDTAAQTTGCRLTRS